MSANEDTEATAILAAFDGLVRASEAGNVDGYVAHLADDAMMMYANTPAVVGKENARGFVTQFFADYQWNFDPWRSEEIEVAGEWAFHRYSGVSISTPKCGGKVLREDRKYIDIWRKDGDAWKVSHHIYNVNTP